MARENDTKAIPAKLSKRLGRLATLMREQGMTLLMLADYVSGESDAARIAAKDRCENGPPNADPEQEKGTVVPFPTKARHGDEPSSL